MSYEMVTTENRVKRDVLFVYDLKLPFDFQPKNEGTVTKPAPNLSTALSKAYYDRRYHLALECRSFCT